MSEEPKYYAGVFVDKFAVSAAIATQENRVIRITDSFHSKDGGLEAAVDFIRSRNETKHIIWISVNKYSGVYQDVREQNHKKVPFRFNLLDLDKEQIILGLKDKIHYREIVFEDERFKTQVQIELKNIDIENKTSLSRSNSVAIACHYIKKRVRLYKPFISIQI